MMTMSRLGHSILVLCCLTLLGCSDDSSTAPRSASGGSGTSGSSGRDSTSGGGGGRPGSTVGGEAGTGPSGGASGAAAGSSSEISAQAAITFDVSDSPNAPTGYTCGATHTLTFGVNPPSAASMGTPHSDGQSGASVDCVVSNAASRQFAGNATDAAGQRFTLDAVIPSQGAGVASVSIFDPQLEIGIADDSCEIVAIDVANAAQDSVWANVRCPHLSSFEDTHLWCMSDGIVAFQKCEQ